MAVLPEMVDAASMVTSPAPELVAARTTEPKQAVFWEMTVLTSWTVFGPVRVTNMTPPPLAWLEEMKQLVHEMVARGSGRSAPPVPGVKLSMMEVPKR